MSVIRSTSPFRLLHLKDTSWLKRDLPLAHTVPVMPGYMILTASEPAASPEPEIMQTLRKVCKLSARRQRQVTELIEVISKPQR